MDKKQVIDTMEQGAKELNMNYEAHAKGQNGNVLKSMTFNSTVLVNDATISFGDFFVGINWNRKGWILEYEDILDIKFVGSHNISNDWVIYVVTIIITGSDGTIKLEIPSCEVQ